MKGHFGHHWHHGHHGHHDHHGHHSHRGHHGHQGPNDGHHGPLHEKHLKLNPHHCMKHKMLKRLHKRDHQRHGWKLHCGRSDSPIAKQANVRNPAMMKHFVHHCKSVFSHFRKHSCDNETAHARTLTHPHHGHKHGCHRKGRKNNEGLQRLYHCRGSSLPPTISLNNEQQL